MVRLWFGSWMIIGCGCDVDRKEAAEVSGSFGGGGGGGFANLLFEVV